MFWRGVLLATGIVISRRDRIRWYVLGRDCHHRSMGCSRHRKRFDLIVEDFVAWICICWTVDFLSRSSLNVSLQSRSSWPLSHPSCCWFEEACARCRLLISVSPPSVLFCPSVHLSLSQSLLKLGPPSECVNKSRVPQDGLCGCYISYQVRSTVRAGRWVGWRTVIIILLRFVFSVLFLSFQIIKKELYLLVWTQILSEEPRLKEKKGKRIWKLKNH